MFDLSVIPLDEIYHQVASRVQRQVWRKTEEPVPKMKGHLQSTQPSFETEL